MQLKEKGENMLYFGHFSFDELGPENQDRHGYFMCTVEAQNADSAANIFKDYILRLKKTAKFFHGVVAVYIEDIVEIRNLPTKPIIIRFQSSEGHFPKSISRQLPVTDHPDIQMYGLKSDVDPVEMKVTAPYQTATPFVEFLP